MQNGVPGNCKKKNNTASNEKQLYSYIEASFPFKRIQWIESP